MTSLLSLITPTNLAKEKAKFMNSSTYHPIFRYIWHDEPVEPVFKNTGKYALWEAIKVQDHDAIVRAASKFFEVDINYDVLELAKNASQVKGIVSHGSAQGYRDLMRDALDSFGLTDITLTISSDHGFNVRPNHHDKIILISEHIHFEYFSMEGSVTHEVAHIIRHRNGKYNKIKRSQNYLPTEEGLASWCQDNTNDDNGLAQHAMEYIASSVGVKASLRETFNALCDLGMSKELAWKRVSRHKFGFVDTSLPGDILKPAMYFANEIKVGQLSPGEKLRLFVGKISMNNLEDHPTYTGLWPADQITEFFHLK